MSDINDSDNETTPPKKFKPQEQKHRQQKFRNEWLKLPEYKNWLRPVEGKCFKAYCKLCGIEMTSELSVLKNHRMGKKHIKASTASSSTSTLDNFFKNSSQCKDNDLIKSAEIRICGFLAEHNISFNAADHLESLIKNCFQDSKTAQGISLKRTKATAIVTNVIGKHEKELLVKKLQITKFSVLVDESTDIATEKTVCIVVRFFEKRTGNIASHFFEMINVFKDKSLTCNAAHLFDLIINAFVSRNISLENIIGFASDGCNIMMGRHNSVSSRFRIKCPGIVIIKCICHSLHICASEASKKLPRSCEDFARNIYNFFKNSSKRINEFEQFQCFTNTKAHKLMHPSQTRWLSLSEVVSRIVEQWSALLLYFTDKYLEERLLAAEQIYKCLNDPFIKLYYYFLEWVLPKFAQMNKYFQSEKVIIISLQEKMESNYKDLLLTFLKSTYVTSTRLFDIDPLNVTQFLNKHAIYLGIKVSEYINTAEIKARPDLIDYFYERCTEFLSTACNEIKKRFDFNNDLFKHLYYFLPKNAMSITFRENVPTLVPLLSQLHRFADRDKWQDIDNEWRQLPLSKIEYETNVDINIFWNTVLNFSNGEIHPYENICSFVLNILCLPHSNAECERVFSKVNLIKTKLRNKLQTDTVNGTILASQHITSNGTCQNFTPPKEMIENMNHYMYKFKSEENISDSIESFDFDNVFSQ